jgi:uncharacterized protein (TIGR03435 family)
MNVTRIVLLLTFSCAVVVSAQNPVPAPAGPAFEVASVRRNVSGGTRWTFRVPPKGLVSFTNVTLRTLIGEAYNVSRTMDRFALIGGKDGTLDPNEADPTMSARFDIQGKPPDDASEGQGHLMLRTMLADRFKLRVHTETRQLPVYVLTAPPDGRLGEHLRPADSACQPSCPANRYASMPGARIVRNGISQSPVTYTMDALARQLQAYGDRPVVNSTGMTGSFTWVVAFAYGLGSVDSPLPVIWTAVEDQLGLRLERRQGPYEVVVVDSVELPTPE